MTPQEANERYLDRLALEGLLLLNESARDACLKEMATYGENRWWEAEDLAIVGYYQLMGYTLLVPGLVFRRGLEALLGRKFETVELRLSNRPKLVAEAEDAWRKKHPQTDTGNGG